MTAKEINQMALTYLSKQNWSMAQDLFFKNAKDNPSHESYNNLGVFLIHEGLTCKNGSVRSAHKLGMKYLQRAAKISTSSTNLCAIATVYDLELRSATDTSRAILYETIYELLTSAYTIEPANEILYNIIIMKILQKAHDETILEDIKKLLLEFVCEESVRLYFEMLRFYSLYDEAQVCIRQYRQILPKEDILLFYSKYQKYDEGYHLCKDVYNQYSPNKYLSSAIVECCINTDHLEEARLYAQYATEVENSISYAGKEIWCKKVFSNLSTSDAYRKELISNYLSLPPFLNMCYYFE